MRTPLSRRVRLRAISPIVWVRLPHPAAECAHVAIYLILVLLAAVAAIPLMIVTKAGQ